MTNAKFIILEKYQWFEEEIILNAINEIAFNQYLSRIGNWRGSAKYKFK